MVTEPLPPLVIVTFVPATICVTPPFKAYDAVDANELDIALEDETANEALVILFDPNGPNTFEPVIKDDVNELLAQDAVPNKEPVNDPENEPLPPCAKLEVKANEAVPANCEVLEPVYELKEAVVNNPLPPPEPKPDEAAEADINVGGIFYFIISKISHLL
jgi:hypothetical protein